MLFIAGFMTVFTARVDIFITRVWQNCDVVPMLLGIRSQCERWLRKGLALTNNAVPLAYDVPVSVFYDFTRF